MDNREWAARLEGDMSRGEDALRKARLHDDHSEYRRVLSLGLMLKAADFSAESRAYGTTLDELLDRHGRARRPLLRKLLQATVSGAGIIAALALILVFLLIIPLLSDRARSTTPVEPEPISSSQPTIPSMISRDHLEAINRALSKESWMDVYSYDPDIRVPTRVTGLWQAPFGETMQGDEGDGSGTNRRSMVLVVRLEGEWQEVIEPPHAPHEWQYKLIEVVYDPETGRQYFGDMVGGEPPFSIAAADQVPPSYQSLDVSEDALEAINAALEVESWLPPASTPTRENIAFTATRIERVVRVNPDEVQYAPGGLEGMELPDTIWAVRVTGDWQWPDWMSEDGQWGLGATPSESIDQLIVLINPTNGKLLGWQLGSTLHQIDYREVAQDLQAHVVQAGESIQSISEDLGLQPETLRWSLWELSSVTPDELEPGMQILYPPIDGAFHIWWPLDTLNLVAEDYGVDPEAMLNWPSNAAHKVGQEFLPDVGEVIFIPMPAEECKLELRLPTFRCN